MQTRRELLATVVPAAVIAVGVVVKWLVSPNAVRDLSRSARAFGVVVVVGIVWLGLMWLLWKRTSAWVRGGVMTALSVALVVALVLPSVRDTEVVEQRDDIAAARETTDDTMAKADSSESAPSSTTAPTTAPVHVATGALVGIDHDATGTANVFREPDGRYVVELLDIDVEPGPDYYLWVVPGREQSGTDGGTELGRLRGNVGTQYYDVPDGTALEGDWTVLIWCRGFTVPIANATQNPI